MDVVRLLLNETQADNGRLTTDDNQPTNSVWKSSWRERPSWLAARSVDKVDQHGREFRRYRVALENTRPRMRLEALADAADNRLQSLRLTEERDGRDELLAAVTVLSYNALVDERRFVVRDTLTEDGRIGKANS